MARLYVLSVLYQPEVAGLRRFLRSVESAVGFAMSDGSLEAGSALLGDCSPTKMSPTPESSLVEMRYLHFSDNLGHSGGCNQLVRLAGPLAEDDVLVFLNPDTMLAPDSLLRLASAVRDLAVGAVDARQIPFEHPKAFDPSSGDESWASGACMAMRAGVFHQVGGFDDRYFWSYCNDVDISWRIRSRGYSVRYIPEAVVFHDKRMNRDGGIEATSTQDFYSTLGRLHLAHRYGRPDVAKATASWIRRSGGDAHRQALKVYLSEQDNGDLPAPLEDAHEVAQFIGQEYAAHRF